MMTLQESKVYIGLIKLREILYDCQFAMDKTNRVVYGTQMMVSLRASLGHYVLAFDDDTFEQFQDEETNKERLREMKLCLAEFANVRLDLDFIQKKNMFHFAKPGEEEKPDIDPNNLKKLLATPKRKSTKKIQVNRWVEIYSTVGELDRDIREYKNSISRGKTIVG